MCDCRLCNLSRRMKAFQEKLPEDLKKEAGELFNEQWVWCECAETNVEWLKFKLDDGAGFEEIKKCILKAREDNNLEHQFYTDEEKKVVYELMEKKGLSYFRLLKQALRVYQMFEQDKLKMVDSGLQKYNDGHVRGW